MNNLTLSKWLLTAKQNEGGGGKIRDNCVHAGEKSLLENNTSIETRQEL